MRNKVLLLAFTMFLVLALVGCKFITPDTDEPVEPVEALSAEVIVIGWEQEMDEINIDYLITNTGTVNIDFSKILFEVTYKDINKDVYMVWIDGIGVEVGCYESGYITEVWVGFREVIDVVAIDWELASYEL